MVYFANSLVSIVTPAEIVPSGFVESRSVPGNSAQLAIPRDTASGRKYFILEKYLKGPESAIKKSNRPLPPSGRIQGSSPRKPPTKYVFHQFSKRGV